MVLDVIFRTLKFQSAVQGWKIDFMMSSKTKSAETLWSVYVFSVLKDVVVFYGKHKARALEEHRDLSG